MEQTGVRVLIVEDESGHAEAIRRAFTADRPADTLLVVGTLEACRETLAAGVPDIVITDIKLPDGKAFELLSSPAAQGSFPVIVMTSYGNEQIAVDAIKAGAIDYVVKSPDSLRAMPRTAERALRDWALMHAHNKVQEQLAAQREELKAVYDGTPVMMCVIDKDRGILNSNRSFQEAVGHMSVDTKQARLCGIMGCINAMDSPLGCGYGSACASCALRIAMHDTLQTTTRHNDVECELSLQRDGVVHPVVLLGSITPMPPLSGSPRALVSLLNITARKKAEDALRISEGRFRSYFNLPMLGIAISSVDKKWVEVNDQLTLLMGYPRDEILRMTWAETTHPDDLAHDIEQFERILSGQIEKYAINKRFIRKDGSIIWTRLGVGCVRKTDNSVDYIIAVISDITESWQVKQNLIESEAMLARSQQVAHIGSWELDLATKRLVWSDELYCIFGLDPHEVEASYDLFCGIIHPDDLEAGKAVYEKTFQDESDGYTIEHRIIRRDSGEIRYVMERCVHERDQSGRVIRSIGMVQDITERRLAEEKALQHLQELEQWYRVTLNREARVLNLKDEVNRLLVRLGEQPRYGKEM